MAKLIDDTVMLDRIADEIVLGFAEHPTGAMRRLGVPDGSADERRLLRKWAAGGEHLMREAGLRARCADEAEDAYHRGYVEGWQKALVAAQKIRDRSVSVTAPPPDPRPSWWSRLFTWAA